ncbi:hypothetical protein BDV93DRAFT_514686 [Ceratobasidium sp. AG-I]|nr:hypothetical protein BDV93DRAFT_514686 [Ceratobasidium sp. AG-I]
MSDLCLFQDSNTQPTSTGLLNWWDSRTPDGEQWFTVDWFGPSYSVQDPSPYDDREMLDPNFWVCGKHLRRPYQFRWEDILSEARQISQRLDIDIDKISFCYRINSATELTRLKDGDWNELPTKLYYHWSPHSSNPCKAEGFMSTEITPDFTLRDQYMTQCWDMRFRLSFDVYNMSDDWGRRYEQIMRSMPGTYPGVRMEEEIMFVSITYLFSTIEEVIRVEALSAYIRTVDGCCE